MLMSVLTSPQKKHYGIDRNTAHDGDGIDIGYHGQVKHCRWTVTTQAYATLNKKRSKLARAYYHHPSERGNKIENMALP